jgi:flagella basal body P-ring formation protein FlgA
MKRLLRAFLIILFLTPAVSAGAAEIDSDQALCQAIREKFALDEDSYEVEVLANRLGPEKVDPDHLAITPLTVKEPIGLFTVMAVVMADGHRAGRGQVRFRIRKFEDVLVATDKIGRHEALVEEKFALKRMEVTSLREQPVYSLEGLADYRAKRNISTDRILTTPAIEPVPDIDVGREVTILISKGRLSITAPGRALQPGSKGDLVKIRNKATGKVIKARVVDSRSVAMDL